MTFEHITVGGVVILSLLVVLTNFYMVGRYSTKREATLIDQKIGLEATRVASLDHELERVRAEIATVAARVTACERDHTNPPTRHDLNNEVMKLVAEMRGLMVGVEGLQRQVGTNNDLLRAVIETGGAR